MDRQAQPAGAVDARAFRMAADDELLFWRGATRRWRAVLPRLGEDPFPRADEVFRAQRP